MCWIDLNNDRLKILGTQFSYNEKLNEEENLFKTVTDIQRVLKIWKMRNLTLEGKSLFLKLKKYQKLSSNQYNNCPKICCEQTWKNTKAFFME